MLRKPEFALILNSKIDQIDDQGHLTFNNVINGFQSQNSDLLRFVYLVTEVERFHQLWVTSQHAENRYFMFLSLAGGGFIEHGK